MAEVARKLLQTAAVRCSFIASLVRREGRREGGASSVTSRSTRAALRVRGDCGRGRPHLSQCRTVKNDKSDDEVIRRKSRSPQEVSSVIVTFAPGAELPTEFKRFARVKGRLGIINGEVLDLPNGAIAQLERYPQIFRIHDNRPIKGHNDRTSLTIGSRAAQRSLGLTGAGIGIAILDSGIAAWHDDLTNGSARLYPYGNQRVSAFVDFVNGRTPAVR